MNNYTSDIAFTPAVKTIQTKKGSRSGYAKMEGRSGWQTTVTPDLGDSRAYRFRDGKLSQVTRDETMAQGLIDAGMDPDSVSKFNHVLVNSFGGGNENAVATIHSLDFDPDDSLLLCTDGLTDMVADDDIAKELGRHSTPQAACDALVELALAKPSMRSPV